MKSIGALLMGLVSSSIAIDRPLYGVDYDTREAQWGGCKSQDVMRLEFRALKSITKHVRINRLDESCADRVVDIASEVGIKLWLGMWGSIDADQDAFESEFDTLERLVEWRRIHNDNVLGIDIATNALYRYYVQENHDPVNDYEGVRRLLWYITRVRDLVRTNLLDVPVTLVDDIEMYTKFPELYDAVDVVSLSQFAQKNGVLAKDAVSYLADRLHNVQVAARDAGKPILIAETGWSCQGKANGVANIQEASNDSSATYLRDFLEYSTQQNIPYYYFTSFDTSWGDWNDAQRHYGLFDGSHRAQRYVQDLVVGPLRTAVRLWHDRSSRVLKVDNVFSRVYLDYPSVGYNVNLDREIWFYDTEARTFRSRSTNQCLDATNLQVAPCDRCVLSQQWQFRGDGSYKVVSRASTERSPVYAPPPAAPVAPPPSQGRPAECGTCYNCQFFSSYFALCYANWGPMDCSRMPKATHRWCGGGSTISYVPPPVITAPPPRSTPAPDIRVQIGALFSSTYDCLHATSCATVALAECHLGDAAVKFSVRPLKTEEVVLSVVGTQLIATQAANSVQVNVQSPSDDHPDTQVWFYDPLRQRIENKANKNYCLQLGQNRAVESRFCDDTVANQLWTYNDRTGQIFHMGKLGLCLTAEGSTLRVEFCNSQALFQRWSIQLAHAPDVPPTWAPAYPPVQTTSPPTSPPTTTVAPTPEPTTTAAPTEAPTTTILPTPPPTTTEAPTTAAPTTTVEPTTTATPTTTVAPTTTVVPTEAPTTLAPTPPPTTTTVAPTTEAPTTTIVPTTTKIPPGTTTKAPSTTEVIPDEETLSPSATDALSDEETLSPEVTDTSSGEETTIRPDPEFRYIAHSKYRIVARSTPPTPSPSER
ncbi:unnamed protein product [Aphanomyces euteiches]